MSARTIFVRGLQVDIWKASFRVEGMSAVVFVGSNMTDHMIIQMVEAVHDALSTKAEQAGLNRAAAKLAALVLRT